MLLLHLPRSNNRFAVCLIDSDGRRYFRRRIRIHGSTSYGGPFYCEHAADRGCEVRVDFNDFTSDGDHVCASDEQIVQDWNHIGRQILLSTMLEIAYYYPILNDEDNVLASFNVLRPRFDGLFFNDPDGSVWLEKNLSALRFATSLGRRAGPVNTDNDLYFHRDFFHLSGCRHGLYPVSAPSMAELLRRGT